MSQTNEEKPVVATVFESSSERWTKYGANAILTSAIVVVLACIVIWGSQQRWLRKRADMTASSNYSLKPQTISIIRDLKKPIKLVSLYARLRVEPGKDAAQQQDFYGPVVDLLEEYKREGKNVELEVIDPVAEPAKLDAWLGEVTRKYGGNVKGYRDELTSFPKTLEQIKKLSGDEMTKMESSLTNVKLTDETQAKILNAAYNTVLAFPTLLQQLDDEVKEQLQKKIPDYKGAIDNLQGTLSPFSRQVGAIQKALEKFRDDEKAPKVIRDYAKDSGPRWEALKKIADDELAKIKGLGELKMDDIRRRLVNDDEEGSTSTRTIAVQGETDIKFIDFKDVWKSGDNSTLARSMGGGKVRLRFAGEQQITAAMLSLTQTQKTKVAFVRGGGQPKTSPMGGRGESFTDIADRLRSYNFDVVEKDLSGQSQMQQRQQMPMPEPSDEEIDKPDVVWVVFDEMAMSQFGPMPASPVLGQRLKKHLDDGGSALVLVSGLSNFSMMGQGADNLSVALKDWGVDVKTNIMAVHEAIESAEQSEDFVEMARRQPPIFVISELGDSPVTTPLRSLDVALVPLLPVVTTPGTGLMIKPILPVPAEPRSWGESDMSFARNDSKPVFNGDKDMKGPLFGGAIVEKQGKGRLVVVGNAEFASNSLLNLPDPKIYNASGRKIVVSRFPGNGELFTNSIFWLSRMDKMMSLSPAAMDTARIDPNISDGVRNFWRIGVMLIGLPLMAVFAGLVVWRKRMD